jgi:HEAT repeat protein
VEPLLSLLGDSDPEVRQMAAFALGLLGDVRARDPLVNLLVDASPLAQGSAAEALGLIGDGAAAEPIARMLAKIVESGMLAQLPGGDAEVRRDAPAAAFRLGVNALVRLKASNQLMAVLLDSAGNPRIRWWPVAYALQRLEDPRALNALQSLAADEQSYTRAFAVKGLGALKDRASLPILAPLAMASDRVVAAEAIRALGSIGDPAGAVALLKIIQERRADPALRLEAVRAAAGTGGAGANDSKIRKTPFRRIFGREGSIA